MIHPSPQFRSRARAPALLALFGTAIWFAACADDPTGPRVRGLRAHLDPGMPTLPYQEWNPPKSCVIGWPAALQSFFPVAFPASQTVCGVQWTVWTPEFIQHRSEYALMFHEFVNYDTSHNKLFSVGTFGDIQNGPLQFTFDKPVSNFTLYLWQVAMAGHAMSAYDANDQKIDSVDFAASPDTQQRTLTAPGIRKVYIYKPLTPPTPGVDRGVLDFVYHRAGFEVPPDTLCKISETTSDSVRARVFNDSLVRREMENMLGRSDTAAAFAQRHEEVAYVFRNLDGTLRVERATFTSIDQCSSKFTPPMDVLLLAIIHTHPFHDQQVPKCPGLETKKYEPLVTGGGSPADFDQMLLGNALRGFNFGSAALIRWLIIDLDRAFYIPWFATEGDFSIKNIPRAGIPASRCRWV